MAVIQPMPGILYVGRRVGLWLFAALLLGGCSDPWKAPVESRSAAGYRGAEITGDSYRVQAGDTLYGIAWRAGVDFRELASWNRVSEPYTIYVGQRLRVSAKGPLPTEPKPEPKVPLSVAQNDPPERVEPTKVAKAAPATPATPPKKSKAVLPSGPLKWRWPTDGKVTGTYSPDDPARKGIKIAGRKGQPVLASEGGQVVYSGSGLVGYGELIILKHSNDYLSAYGHNSKRLVSEGQSVARGATIAEMGIAGGKPQLHFEIRRRGKPVNPLSLLPNR